LIQPEGDYGYEKFKPECRKFLDYMSAKVRNYPLVILGAMWSVYMRNPAFSADLKRTLETLTRNGQYVILLGQVPEFLTYDRNCELNALKTGTQSSCASRAVATRSSPPSYNRTLMAIAESMPGVAYVDIDQIICPASHCSAYLDDRPIYFDAFHLSMDGSWVVGRYAAATPAWKQVFKVTEAGRAPSSQRR
jgi:hypothetical protein